MHGQGRAEKHRIEYIEEMLNVDINKKKNEPRYS